MSTTSWMDAWLSVDRLRKYRLAAGGDDGLALALYDWNAEVAAAFLRDLGHLEVGIRNAYDRALLRHPALRGRDWLQETTPTSVLFPGPPPTAEGRPARDKHAVPRSSIRQACSRAGHDSGRAPRGKAVAELMFGFWSYLTGDPNEKTLWVPSLHTAYVDGTDRARVHAALSALRAFRNRVAHHESVFDRAPEDHRRRIVYVAKHLSPELKDHIVATSHLPAVLAARPRRAVLTRAR